MNNQIKEQVNKTIRNNRMQEYSLLSQDEIDKLRRDEFVEMIRLVYDASKDIDWNAYNYNSMIEYNNLGLQKIPLQFNYYKVKAPKKVSKCLKNEAYYSSIFEAYLFEVGAFINIDYNKKALMKYMSTTMSKERNYIPDAVIDGVFIECKGVMGSCDDYGQKYVDIKNQGGKVLIVLQHRDIIIPNPLTALNNPVTQEEYLIKHEIPFVYADDLCVINTLSDLTSFSRSF